MIPPRIRCSFNFPGHEPHFGRIRNFLRNRPDSTAVIVKAAPVNRTTIQLTSDDGALREFRHHQPDRIAAAFTECNGQAKLYSHERLLSVPHGENREYFFSLATTGFLTCREHRERLDASMRAAQGLTERHALVAYRLRGPTFGVSDSKSERDLRRPRHYRNRGSVR